MLFNIAYAGLAIPSGILSDYIGRKKTRASEYAILGLEALGFAFVSSMAGLVLLFILYEL
jgi:MFS family permease